jgi:hypothetical protein
MVDIKTKNKTICRSFDDYEMAIFRLGNEKLLQRLSRWVYILISKLPRLTYTTVVFLRSRSLRASLNVEIPRIHSVLYKTWVWRLGSKRPTFLRRLPSHAAIKFSAYKVLEHSFPQASEFLTMARHLKQCLRGISYSASL